MAFFAQPNTGFSAAALAQQSRQCAHSGSALNQQRITIRCLDGSSGIFQLQPPAIPRLRQAPLFQVGLGIYAAIQCPLEDGGITIFLIALVFGEVINRRSVYSRRAITIGSMFALDVVRADSNAVNMLWPSANAL